MKKGHKKAGTGKVIVKKACTNDKKVTKNIDF